MFKKILISNRGEIAIRIIQAAKEMGIKTGVIYSRSDFDSKFVKLADEAFLINCEKDKNPYLDIDSIISIAKENNFEAIHPGYGFLAENASFASICKKNGIVFIGPDEEVIKICSNKKETKKFAKMTGIPTVPEFDENKINAEDFPVMIKASFGGGGKGIRKALNKGELEKFLKIVKQEAGRAFGKEDIIIEKVVQSARHVEVQILRDSFGKTVHLFDRECSIQRKNQKIIEEAPAIGISEKVRKQIFSYAIALAKKINYTNAGTFEFLISDERIFFIEINPRIQVEHTVTEEITGIDIVKKQIEIASGEKLNIDQKDINPFGHSIEFRICAEDIEDGFKSVEGKICELLLPTGKGIRICSDLFVGKKISSQFDSLIMKLIITADSRNEAIERAKNAFNELKISGIKTNIPLLIAILKSLNFIKGNITTDFLVNNNSIKIAKKIMSESKDFINEFRQLEFEKTALTAAVLFEKFSKEKKDEEMKSNWIIKGKILN